MGTICCGTTPLEKNCLNLYYEIPDQYTSKAINTSAFTFTQVLGIGSFGRVFLVFKNDTCEKLAMKVINKTRLTAPKKKMNALTERNVLASVVSPFIVKLHYAFQSSVRLFLVMEYCEGQDLYVNMRRSGGRFPEDWT